MLQQIVVIFLSGACLLFACSRSSPSLQTPGPQSATTDDGANASDRAGTSQNNHPTPPAARTTASESDPAQAPQAAPPGWNRPVDSQPAGRPDASAAASPPAGSFAAKPEAAQPLAETAPLTPEDQARYDAVALALVRAMNAEDKKAYRELHTAEAWAGAIDWWRDMFAVQRAKFGPIVRAYPVTHGTLRFGKVGFRGDGPTFVAIFEESVGGAFTFELDGNGKISRTSVFIKQELADYSPGALKPIFERR